MTSRILFGLTLAATALAGCETTIDLPEPPHTPKVALMYTLTTAPLDSSFQYLFETRQLYVSKSQSVFSSDDIRGRNDATAELRDADGRVVERYRSVVSNNNLYYSNTGYYRPVLGFRPQPGQTYTLRTSLPGLEAAESTLTMPQPAVVESGTYAPAAGNGSSNQFQGRLSVVLRDNPNTADYYLAFARVLDRQGRPGDWSPVQVDYQSQSSSVSIGQFQFSSPGQQYSLYPFADTDVNGQRISMVSDVNFYSTCSSRNCPQELGYLEVTVSSITRDAYEFYLSRRRYYDSDGNPFAEPAPLASNVRAGYGLFAGSADATYRIRLF